MSKKQQNQEIEQLKLNEKYRPDKFKSVVGQENCVKSLVNSILTNQVQNSYIFAGLFGLGKTSLGRIFANSLICQNRGKDAEPCGECKACKDFKINPYFAGLIEVDAGSEGGIERIRNLINEVQVAPKYEYKIIMIDEFQQVSQEGNTALLKTIEEPPKNVIFLLLTTEINKIKDTIQSRSIILNFEPVDTKSVAKRLKYICDEENIKITDDALESLVIGSKGGMRDSIKNLQQASIQSNGNITKDSLTGIIEIEPEYIKDILSYILQGNSVKVLSVLDSVTKVEESHFNFLLSRIRKALFANEISDELVEALIGVQKIFIENKNKSNYNVALKTIFETASLDSAIFIKKNSSKHSKELLSLLDLEENSKSDKSTLKESTTNVDPCTITINKIELFKSILSLYDEKYADIFSKYDLKLVRNYSVLLITVDKEDSKAEVTNILKSSIAQNLKPLLNIKYLVKVKDAN